MADYMCKHCKFNNNGWCVAKKKNKLPEILECDSFKRGIYGQFEALSTSEKAIQIIKELTSILEKWGKYEDGIPAEFWDSYKKAKAFIGDAVN